MQKVSYDLQEGETYIRFVQEFSSASDAIEHLKKLREKHGISVRACQ